MARIINKINQAKKEVNLNVREHWWYRNYLHEIVEAGKDGSDRLYYLSLADEVVLELAGLDAERHELLAWLSALQETDNGKIMHCNACAEDTTFTYYPEDKTWICDVCNVFERNDDV